MSVQIICVVVQEIHGSLLDGQPCVIVAGSGRAADILAYACQHAVKPSVRLFYM